MANKSDSILETGTPANLNPSDFENYLPWAVKQFEGDIFKLVITKVVEAQYVSAADPKDRKSKPRPKSKTEDNEQIVRSGVLTPDTESESTIEDDNPVYMEVVYNDANQLVAIKFNKNKKIPRCVLKVINLVIKFHSQMSSLTIHQGLSAEVIHEISKFYATNRITELILDNCYVPQANYDILLDNHILKHFSLSRCCITDSAVKNIASKLTSPAAAAKSLSALNLSTNRITDIGVQYLATMLRTNRQLSYLSLAHNTITDEGVSSIVNVLNKFALTKEERMYRSKRFMYYLNRKSELMTKTVEEIRSGELEKKLKRKLTRATNVKSKMVTESSPTLETASIVKDDSVYSQLKEPFNNDETDEDERGVYCLGNNTLRYLNLAYNNFTFMSVRAINEVLKYQKLRGRKLGLLNIRIEGNMIPRSCDEYESIDDMLLPGLVRRYSHSDHFRKEDKRKTTATRAW